MIDPLWRDAILAAVALAVLGYLGTIVASAPIALHPVALFLGLSVAALGAVGYDRVHVAAETSGEGVATWLAAREVTVALAVVLFVVLARLATVQGPPPSHVDAGVLWFVVGAAGGTLLLAVGAAVRRAVRAR